MTTQAQQIKRMVKGGKLEGLTDSSRDKVELVGFDGTGSILGRIEKYVPAAELIRVVSRGVHGTIEISRYFETKSGLSKSASISTYKKGDKEFDKYDAYLAEVEL